MSHDHYPGWLSFPLRFPNRRFRIWSYVPSHSGLVLRTEFEPDAPHIELLFQGVRQINLPATMPDGLVADIEHTNDDDPHDVTFLLGNDHFSGHVLAGYLFLKQEERSKYSAFSLFHGYLRSDFER
ncbi:hypothetical protein ACIBIZ_49745 [Nonomuraea spiralis]|uniref:hypothetical protein n=1 Tax=Nonomuraea spiralis TaxID=46182 RepID=UPI003796663B